MNKAELIDSIAEESGISRRSSEAALNAITKIVMGTVADGDKVSLIGFGSFFRAERLARDGRNPATGEKITIKAKTVPKFSPGKVFKEMLD